MLLKFLLIFLTSLSFVPFLFSLLIPFRTTRGKSRRWLEWDLNPAQLHSNPAHEPLYCFIFFQQELNSLEPHENFRLWLTAESHPKFPTILLQSSLKVTYEVRLKHRHMCTGLDNQSHFYMWMERGLFLLCPLGSPV